MQGVRGHSTLSIDTLRWLQVERLEPNSNWLIGKRYLFGKYYENSFLFQDS